MTNEQIRLEEARERKAPLEEAGPYLWERQSDCKPVQTTAFSYAVSRQGMYHQ